MLNHKTGTENKVADILSRRSLLLNSVRTEVVGFEQVKEEYESCPDFKKIFQTLAQGPSNKFSEYTLLDGFLFRDNKLCIPRTSLRKFLVWETHAGGLAGHFGKDKTILAIEDQFFWPSLKRDVAQIVARCRTCAVANRESKTLACIPLYLYMIVLGKI